MKDIIQQIMNQENLDEIYGYAQNALFKDGPVSITTLEILSYDKTVFNKFKLYIDECRSLTDPQALQLIDRLRILKSLSLTLFR